jgi:hypothetical protein
MIKTELYTVSRVRKNDVLYGKVHYSSDSYSTHCGKTIDGNWFVLTNDFTGTANCAVCLHEAKQKETYEIKR